MKSIRRRERNSPTISKPLLLLSSLFLLATFTSPVSSSSPALPLFNAPPLSSTSRSGFLKDVLQSNHNLNSLGSSGEKDICRPTGQIQDACCDYETVEDINTSFFDELAELVKTKYFRYYKVDLYKDCPFWVDNSLCMNRDCTVQKVEEVSRRRDWVDCRKEMEVALYCSVDRISSEMSFVIS